LGAIFKKNAFVKSFFNLLVSSVGTPTSQTTNIQNTEVEMALAEGESFNWRADYRVEQQRVLGLKKC